jgi:nucleoside phosphorylase
MERVGLRGSRVIIIGPMGAGKSVLLLHLYLQSVKNAFLSGASIRFTNFHDELQRTLEAHPQPTGVTFVDSLDESTSDQNTASIDSSVRRLLTLDGLVLACRTPFYYDAIHQYCAQFDIIVELAPMAIDQQAAVIAKYFQSPALQATVSTALDPANALLARCRSGPTGEGLLVATPLFAALCCVVAAESPAPHRLAGIAEVYAAFLKEFVKRKFHTDTSGLHSLARLASVIDLGRQSRRAVNIDDLTAKQRTLVGRAKDLLLIRSGFDPSRIIVRDFRHRSIGEYLVALHVVSFVVDRRSKSPEIAAMLNRMLNYETSYFVRRLIEQLNKRERGRLARRLRRIIENQLTESDGPYVAACHNAAYFYFSCTDDEERLTALVEYALDPSSSVHPLVVGTLIAVAFTHGKSKLQTRMLSRLDNHSGLRSRNLNYHRSYYGDTDCASPNSLLTKIGCGAQWDRTRAVLLGRLRATDAKRLRFRAFDLMTLRQFIEDTKYLCTVNERTDMLSMCDLLPHGSDPAADTLIVRESARLRAVLGAQRDKDTASDEAHGQIKGTATESMSNAAQGGQHRGLCEMTKATELRGKVEVVIVTVREDEYEAVLMKARRIGAIDGSRRYALCQSCEDGPIVAVVRTAEQGNGEAQDACRDAIEDLDPKCIALVGIGGGVPCDEYSLGDVVVATRIVDMCVEAVIAGGDREYSIAGGPMHRKVTTKLADLAGVMGHGPAWNSEDNVGMRMPVIEYSCQLKYYGKAAWRTKVQQSLKRASDRRRTDRSPIVTVGPIASSDRLMKDDELLAVWLKVVRQVRAIEMEAAGVCKAARRSTGEIPVVVVRGISDIVGFKRDPLWTSYAAKSAAAFAAAFVQACSGQW